MKLYFYKINKKTGRESDGEITTNAGLMVKGLRKDITIFRYNILYLDSTLKS